MVEYHCKLTDYPAPRQERTFKQTMQKTTYIQYYESPLGQILLSGTAAHLTGLWFAGQKYFGAALPEEYFEKNTAIFDQVRKWLDIYFAGKEPDFTPPLSMEATPFRKAVWEILLAIPYGHTMTYGEISEKITRQGITKTSPRAVGGAVGHNPISLIIPCHRVIGADGKLTGYAGGMERKLWLLNMEKAESGEQTETGGTPWT